jgi:hypothetical protein
VTPALAQGDTVRIRPTGSTENEWARAVVAFSSENGRSIAIAPDEHLMRTSTGTWLGGIIPLNIDYEAETVADLLGNECEPLIG